jgi:tRNA(His) guanylyltransferase
MDTVSLADRIGSYQELTDYQLIKKLPVIILINGRSFAKATSLLDKPYCAQFTELMVGAMVKLCQEVEGIVFSLTFNDQIILVLRNDQTINTEAWYNNKIQAIVSAAASIATLEFNRIKNENSLHLLGDPIFTAKAFVVPNISELINTIIHMQQNCFHTALSQACFYELLKTHGAQEAKNMLAGKNPKQKADILFNECKVEFNDYPLPFKRGIGAYRSPKVSGKNKEIKQKLILNDELPLFTQEKEWLYSILRAGHDQMKLDIKND